MKTLRDYIKGYGYVPILLIAQHISEDGTRYQLVKEEKYPTLYYLKGEEVVKKEYLPNDKYVDLAIDHLNHPHDVTVIEDICDQLSYQHFVKFVYDQCGEEFHL